MACTVYLSRSLGRMKPWRLGCQLNTVPAFEHQKETTFSQLIPLSYRGGARAEFRRRARGLDRRSDAPSERSRYVLCNSCCHDGSVMNDLGTCTTCLSSVLEFLLYIIPLQELSCCTVQRTSRGGTMSTVSLSTVPTSSVCWGWRITFIRKRVPSVGAPHALWELFAGVNELDKNNLPERTVCGSAIFIGRLRSNGLKIEP